MKHLLIVLLVALTFCTAYSQDDIDQLIRGGKEDANYLVRGYVAPALNTISAGFAQGWYNTAKTHKLIGFDLTLTASAIYYPTSDLTYRVENSSMRNLAVTPATNTFINAPTVFGSSTAPTYQLLDPNSTTTPKQPLIGQTTPGAPGLDLKKEGIGFIPVAMLQLGIGLPKGTDLKFRFLPNIKIGDGGSTSMFGFGIMHDIKQHIPGIKELPFDLSAFVGYTKFKLDVALDNTAPDQKANFETNSTTVQALISKKLSVLTFYGGLGYNFNNASLAIKGIFDVDGNNPGTVTVSNPVDVSVSQSGPRFTAGMRLKLAIVTLHGDYTFQKYNALTVGFGFSVR
jgi:hypothetical protein